MKLAPALLALAILGGCRASKEDLDLDGIPAELDCDDTNPLVGAGLPELCDGIDNDCDGIVDNSDTEGTVFYVDSDGDGFGDSSATISACEQPAGAVRDATDCDDSRDDVYPGAPEDDCEGTVDLNCDGSVGFEDNDRDGISACDDCNDADPNVNPGAVEICDGIDNNCDGSIDGPEAVGAVTSWADADGDGFGDADDALLACDVPATHVLNDADCDDSALLVNPAALERCNGIDDNCDELVDGADSVDAVVFYADDDGDGFGDPSDTLRACEPPAGAALDAGDCNDTNAAVNPEAGEQCNGIDDDCDRRIDEDPVVGTTYYQDNDSDGYGNPDRTELACSTPTGFTDRAGDCDDLDVSANPAGVEVCDGDDEDCDGEIDEEGATGERLFYADGDDDGWGVAEQPIRACTQPDGYALRTGDCEDDNPAVSPDAVERCNSIDDDCSGRIDDDAVDAPTWYGDLDRDGYGSDALPREACEQPSGHSATGGDCDDLVAAVNPGAEELCNRIDDNCNEVIDEPSATDAVSWFPDGDDDGWGTTAGAVTACYSPDGSWANQEGDCDDAAATTFPGAPERCNGVDDDCDPATDEEPSMTVVDGSLSTDGDLFYQYSPVLAGQGYLRAAWTPDPRADSYDVAIGTSPLGDDVMGWTNRGASTAGQLTGLSLRGAWDGDTYYVSVRPVAGGEALSCAAASSNGVQIAEAAVWTGNTASLRPDDDQGGATDDWPTSGMDSVYGAHWFESVDLSSTVNVQGWGFADDVPAGIASTDPRVSLPSDGWLALYANTITLRDGAVITASGRGYGGGGGGAAGCDRDGDRGNGGASGLGGAGGRAENAGCAGGGGGGGGSPMGAGGAAQSAGGAGNLFGGGGGGTGQWGAGYPGAAGGLAGGGGAAGGVGTVGMTGGSRAVNTSAPGGAGEFRAGGGGGGSQFLSGSSGGGGGGGGYGAGGGGGNESEAGGGGAGGSGGSGGGVGTNGLAGAGPFAGAGSAGVTNVRASNGGRGGYGAAGSNGDSSTDRSWRLGSGGGGGGGSNSQAAGGGGAAGGGAILLHATDSLTIDAGARLLANGAGGGGGAGDDNSSRIGGAGGPGAGGTLLLEAPWLQIDSTGFNVSARGGDGLTANGGTIKLFYQRFMGTLPTATQAGRIYDAGAGSYSVP